MKEKTLTYEQVLELIRETNKSIIDLRINQAKTDAQLAKTNSENDKIIKEVSKQIAEHGKQIGGINRSFGKFTEDLFFNSLSRLMKEKFGVQFFEPSKSREKGDSTIEIDAMGIVNGSINAVYLTEIKSKYEKKSISQLTKIIKNFDSFFPELSDKKKFGIIAVPNLKEEHTKEILKAGFYPATLKNDLVVIDTPLDFKPREF